MFNNVDEAISFIENKRNSNKNGHLNVDIILDILNKPYNNYKKIHIGGTNGKGSTVSFLANLLINHNYKVGTFTSPFITNFNERIRINNLDISDEELLYYINRILEIEKSYPLTFFEFITVIAFLYFSDKNVDYALIEVGIGGLNDVTNLVNYDLSLITNVGYDHMDILGNTIEEILYNKLGIIKENNTLITTITNFNNEIINYCLTKNSKCIILNEINIIKLNPLTIKLNNNIYELSLNGIYQASNAVLAITAFKYLIEEYKEDIIKYSLKNTKWPGRFEIYRNIIIDGAHNIHGMNALVNSLKSIYPNEKFTFVFCVMKDKESIKMLSLIKDISNLIILTKIDYDRSQETNFLFKNLDFNNKIIINNLEDIFEYINTLDNKIIFTGSLYFISLVRKYLLKLK